ncbi:MAG: nucleotidyl transferase AbiEii/AbiGii toxin family protein [Candidatus Scalindua sp.]
MNGETALHTDILTETQKNVLKKLAMILSGTDFYLAGGTALALQIGHRMSIDFDWFIPRLGDPDILFRKIKNAGIDYTAVSIDIETIYLNIDGIQVSFIGYDYPLFAPKILLNEYDIYLASPDDIACMKLSAIGGRGSRKDFIDIYFLIKQFRSLDDYLRIYMQKFNTRDIGHIVRSLVYFDDAEAEPEIKMVKPISWENLKADMEKSVKKLKL